jgi:hypothetical protein
MNLKQWKTHNFKICHRIKLTGKINKNLRNMVIIKTKNSIWKW